jgi:hypothetical protein
MMPNKGFELPDWLQDLMAGQLFSPKFHEACRQGALAAWAVTCMRKVLQREVFQPMPLVELVRHLAAKVEGQPRPAEEIANLAIENFQLTKKVSENYRDICRFCGLMDLTASQTVELCLATEPELDRAEVMAMIEKDFAHLK